MRIGVPKEIKDHEDRVGLVPSSVGELVAHGHTVLIEKGAGRGAGLADRDYVKAGARIVDGADAVWGEAEMIVKVKEPLAVERKKLRPDHLLFTYLHLAPDAEQTRDLVDSGATCIAYETVTSASGGLPLLTPMSEVAGRMAAQVAPTPSRTPPRGVASCSAACPASPRPGSSSSAAASPAPTPPPSRWAWAPTSPWSTVRPRRCAASTPSSAPA